MINATGGSTTALAFTTGFFSGSATAPDLALVTTPDAFGNSLVVLQNLSTASNLFFLSHSIIGSSFPGTPVAVAGGQLSTGGNYTQAQDIAVAYQRTSDNESMVATFRNLQGAFNFSRTVADRTGGRF